MIAERSIELPALSRRAAFTPSSIDEEDRSIEVTFSTGAGVERRDYETGTRYIERLSLKPEHVRLERLNSGAPVLDSHTAYSVGDIVGVVDEGSARVDGKVGTARVRFSRRA